MPFCINCGKENKLAAKFCIGCGKIMPQQSPTSEVEKANHAKAMGSPKTSAANLHEGEQSKKHITINEEIIPIVKIQKISGKKFTCLFLVYCILFFLTLYFFFQNLSIYTVGITVIFAIITFGTMIYSAFAQTTLKVDSQKKFFDSIRIALLPAIPIVSIVCAWCSEALNSQHSIYKPLYRSLINGNISEIKNDEIVLHKQKIMYFFDISETMKQNYITGQWHKPIIAELLKPEWQIQNDTAFKNKLVNLNSIGDKLNYIDASALTLCKEIIDYFRSIGEEWRDSSLFTVLLFSNHVNKCSDWSSFSLKNVKQALRDIICSPYHSGINNLTKFNEVLDCIENETQDIPVRDPFEVNHCTITIISDFLHDIDQSNIGADTTNLKSAIERLKQKNLRIKLLTVVEPPKTKKNKIIINVDSLIHRKHNVFVQKIGQIQSIMPVIFYKKSKKEISLFYDDPSHTESACVITNVFPEKKRYSFNVAGAIENEHQYYLKDEENKRLALILGDTQTVEFKRKVILQYTGEAVKNQKISIGDYNTGVMIGYNVVFSKSLNFSKALTLLFFLFFVGFLIWLFWISYLLIMKYGSLDLLCSYTNR